MRFICILHDDPREKKEYIFLENVLIKNASHIDQRSERENDHQNSINDDVFSDTDTEVEPQYRYTQTNKQTNNKIIY